MATRLERLWVLLDSGSTPVTRKAAAEQIGEVQKLHPHELHTLLRKVCVYLNSKSWETRIAAGQAVEAIAKNVKKWQPTYQPKQEEGKQSPDNDELLCFTSFDITKVLTHGTALLSSTGDEYQALENDPEYQKMSSQERLAFHRQQLKQRLGLVAQGKVFSTGVEQLFEDSDLVIQPGGSPLSTEIKRNGKSFSEVHELSALQLSGMSARERNRARRKAKQMARRASKDVDVLDKNEADPPPYKKPKTTSVVVEQAGTVDKLLIDQVTDAESVYEESEEWPFTWFCEEMFRNLFNPAWEVRHGAATALREVMRHHGDTAGITVFTPPDKCPVENQRWLVDAAIRMMCVFALDRFADFVSDQVVTPVRATCAQALGMVVRVMNVDQVKHTVAVLVTLAAQEQWEVRYASLMGMQHLLAARTDLSSLLLPSLSPAILRGLRDVDDDVRAVAASALLPVAGKLHHIIPDKVETLLLIIWDSLIDLDDLSASTNSIMELLCTLLSCNPSLYSSPLPSAPPAQSLSTATGSNLATLVPRLWPFLAHTISSVRRSCLTAILTILTCGQHGDVSKDETPMDTSAGDGDSKNESGIVVSAGAGRMTWLKEVLQNMLCHVFQRFALEGVEENRELIHKVWYSLISQSTAENLSVAVSPVVTAWLCLLVAPSSSPVQINLLVPSSPNSEVSSNLYLGGCTGVETPASKEQAAFAARVTGARALGQLAFKLSNSSLQSIDSSTSTTSKVVSQFLEGLQQLLGQNVAIRKIISSLVVCFWEDCPKASLLPPLNTALTVQGGYEELVPHVLALQKDCHVLIVAFDKKGFDIAKDVTPSGYTAEFAGQLATTMYQNALKSLKLSNAEKQEFDSLCRSLLTSLGQLQEEHQRLNNKVQSCVAGALVSLSSLPGKFNPIIRPFMDCIKLESDPLMQQLAAEWLSQLLDVCRTRTPCPNSKIIKNLCSFACCDPHHTPTIHPESGTVGDDVTAWNWHAGIITLAKEQKQHSSRIPHGRGRPSAAVKEAMAAAITEEQRKPLLYQRQGAESALISMARHFGPALFSSLPQLLSFISQPLDKLPTVTDTEEDPSSELIASAQVVVNSLQILEVIAPALEKSLRAEVLLLLPNLLSSLCFQLTAVRHMAARCLATVAQVELHSTMQFIIGDVLPFLGDTKSVVHREGVIEAIACVLETVGMDILCYVVLLLMPVLARMSDQVAEVRLMASRCFATLVSLMPLEAGVDSPPEMAQTLAEQRLKERMFIEQLLDTNKLDNYSVPVPIKADLRKYQQDGINWLAFLNKYNLHGILCDGLNMGLGKTLQSLCIMAGDHYHRATEYQVTEHADDAPLPSLVVCPPTLTGHWYYEVKKFCNDEDLNPLQYSGPPNTRARLQVLVPNYNLIIASYDIVRNDIDFFREISWNYCILDEGHIIKNTKTKITKAVKQLKANHRLILSGTPIQNNVLELWSLFDFLMPGFLGTEKQFYQRFGKPIILSRDAKSSSKEQEAGALAMESLHRQVLPFLLRRMKEDVLQDLPPKIIQDYYCDLSSLQVQLYEDFAKSRAKQDVDETIEAEDEEDSRKTKTTSQSPTHIFQALQYLRKVCNHPALVVSPDHPLYSKVQDYLKNNSTDLKDIRHSAKLTALKQLLHDCGIGMEGAGEEELTSSAVGQHRVLIFCQYKSMLDIIERDLIKTHMPTVTFLRLDGSVPASDRFPIVQKFNSDPSIDALLLTTHVGGLGLNLTGADTVIFFEHDWNPMKDLQAMDRAHRIGQKKVVNVYRLITRGTLEEKILSLQKFKLNIANAVISQENSSLLSMNTSELLDLFQLSDTSESDKTMAKATGGSGVAGMRSMMQSLPELWAEDQYSNEYDLSSFMKSLSHTRI